MKVDNFLANYSAYNPLLEDVAKNSSSFHAVKNFVNTKYKVNESEVVANSEYDKALKEQTDAFEAFLIKSVLDISLKEKASLFGKDASDEIYASMYNDTMSKALSGGLGFSKLLFDFLKERS